MTENNEWFPEGYTVPEAPSSFMTIEDGENTIRILSKPVMGYCYWTKDKKKVYSKEEWAITPDDAALDKNGKPTAPKYFWAFLVYNYATKTVQSLEITQSTIMKPLKALIDNPKWGNPTKFDITLNKTGKELLTKYAVVPNPHSEITPEMSEALASTTIDLESVFNN